MLVELRRAGPKPRLFLADREFCTVVMTSAFDGAGEKFLMHARMAAGIKKALAEYGRGRRKKASRSKHDEEIDYSVTRGRHAL